jgi:ABC-type uncharacterized transport system YnjBCD ATPase subunit
VTQVSRVFITHDAQHSISLNYSIALRCTQALSCLTSRRRLHDGLSVHVQWLLAVELETRLKVRISTVRRCAGLQLRGVVDKHFTQQLQAGPRAAVAWFAAVLCIPRLLPENTSRYDALVRTQLAEIGCCALAD